MPAHVWETHKNCDRMGCVICEGGLAICTICNGMEGTLTTDCPGVSVPWWRGELVYADDLDWTEEDGWVGPLAIL